MFFGLYLTGGVARKMLKLSHGITTEMDDIDVDLVLVSETRETLEALQTLETLAPQSLVTSSL